MKYQDDVCVLKEENQHIRELLRKQEKHIQDTLYCSKK